MDPSVIALLVQLILSKDTTCRPATLRGPDGHSMAAVICPLTEQERDAVARAITEQKS